MPNGKLGVGPATLNRISKSSLVITNEITVASGLSRRFDK